MDRSLDEFLDGDDGDGPGPADDPGSVGSVDGSGEGDEPDHEDADEPEAEAPAVEPAVSTFDWTPGGADCEACGDAVDRRWRDDDGMVCVDCKAW